MTKLKITTYPQAKNFIVSLTTKAQGARLSATSKCSETKKGVLCLSLAQVKVEHRLKARRPGVTPMDSLLRASSRWRLELDTNHKVNSYPQATILLFP
ncbi:hypothetical protein J14TS2_51950 [Bacillus sp. J14TS2]|nr:hypothetical protein J14TS2_51950 [Bacillus sp. J14TS2]